MSKLQILKEAVKRPSSAAGTSTGKGKYRESFNFVAFHSKVNLRRKLRSKSSPFGNFLDIDSDFKDAATDKGPKLEASEDINQSFIDQLQAFFVVQNGRLHRKYVYRILSLVEKVYRRHPLMVDVTLPPEALINICGDVHGQLYDLIKIFKLQGM